VSLKIAGKGEEKGRKRRAEDRNQIVKVWNNRSELPEIFCSMI